MSESRTYTIGLPWGLAFIVIKVWSSILATRSWWWLLLAPVPILYVIFQKLGLI